MITLFSRPVCKPENCCQGTEQACAAELGCDELRLQRDGLNSLQLNLGGDWQGEKGGAKGLKLGNNESPGHGTVPNTTVVSTLHSRLNTIMGKSPNIPALPNSFIFKLAPEWLIEVNFETL